MTDSQDTPKDEEVKEEGLTEDEERALAWMNYVSEEVNALLGMFLPLCRSGTVGVVYDKVVKAVYESGPEYDPDKAKGVEIRLVFDFEGIVAIPKE
jgi:hypothetical protein